MQLESGKIIAIRTALKVGHNKDKTVPETTFMAREMQKRNPTSTPNKIAVTSTIVSSTTTNTTLTTTIMTNSKVTSVTPSRQRNTNHVQFGRNNSISTNKNVQMGTAKPYNLKTNSRNVGATSDGTSVFQGQYPMSNSSSSFDADISDDSQFLEKLGENLTNQQNCEDENIQINKTKETKCSDNVNQSTPSEQKPVLMKSQINQQRSHVEKVNNSVSDTLTNTVSDKPSSVCHSQAQSKCELQIGHPYHNNNTENYSNINSASSYLSHQNYNYNYNLNNNGNYDDTHNVQPGQTAQHTMQPNMMDSHHTERYPHNAQSVSFSIIYSSYIVFEPT